MQTQHWYEKVKAELIPKYGSKKLDLHCQLGAEAIGLLGKNNERFDLIFVDGIFRGDCINQAFDLGYKYVVTHDTEDMVYPYGWDKIKTPEGLTA